MIRLPQTDLDVFDFAFGSAKLGQKSSETDAVALLDAYAGAGGNFIDTARVYYAHNCGEENLSERIIGDWIASRNNRDDLVLLTKGGHHALTTGNPRLDAGALRSDITGSLDKLRTDQIDIYCLHRDDPARPVEDIIGTLEAARDEGLIRYYGCSNWSPERIDAANSYAFKIGALGFVSDQNFMCLGSVGARPGSDPSCTKATAGHWKIYRKWNMSLTAYTSLASGFFHKHIAGGQSVGGQFDTEQNKRLSHVIAKAATRHGLTVSQIMLGFLWSLEQTVIPVAEPRTAGQVEDLLKAVNTRLDLPVRDALADAAELAFCKCTNALD